MIKILHILTDSNFGGAGRYLVNYLKARDRERFSVSLVLPTGSLILPHVAELDVPVIQVDGIGDQSFSLTGIRKLGQVIAREKPDIVHTHGSFSGRVAAKLWGKRVIYTRHCAFPVPGYLRRGPFHWLNGAVNCLFADHVIAVSPAAKENLVDSGIPEKRITVMMNGSDPVPPCDGETCKNLRKTLEIPEGAFVGGLLARIELYKGQGQLLEAAEILHRQGRDFVILLAGTGSEAEEIQQRIRSMGLSGCVRYLGFVEQVSQVLSILDVQLNCSSGTETSSLSIIEGMSMGLPTVASDYGGNPWLIDDGVTGLLYPTGSSQALAEKLEWMMDHPEEVRTMGEKAREAYLSRFTGEIFAKNIETVYEKLCIRK